MASSTLFSCWLFSSHSETRQRTSTSFLLDVLTGSATLYFGSAIGEKHWWVSETEAIYPRKTFYTLKIKSFPICAKNVAQFSNKSTWISLASYFTIPSVFWLNTVQILTPTELGMKIQLRCPQNFWTVGKISQIKSSLPWLAPRNLEENPVLQKLYMKNDLFGNKR